MLNIERPRTHQSSITFFLIHPVYMLKSLFCEDFSVKYELSVKVGKFKGVIDRLKMKTQRESGNTTVRPLGFIYLEKARQSFFSQTVEAKNMADF